MVNISNQLPASGAQFPAPWVDEFKNELVSSALARVRVAATTLLLIEGVLLLSDFYRTRWFVAGVDSLFVWRAITLAFLLSYRFVIEKTVAEDTRLRYFLIAGMVLCGAASAVLANIVGDMSTFVIGALGVAAACPLPGRFNASLFIGSGSVLLAWLYLNFPQTELYWASNIVAACVIGIVIEKFTFDAALREFTQRKNVEKQRERSDALLYNVFPESVATLLKAGQRSIALHGEVTILFADVVGFTKLSTRLLPSQLLDVLEELFGEFDQLAHKHGIEKIKTIGDAYMAVSGAPCSIDHPVERMACFALEVVQATKHYAAESALALDMRVGMHTGPVVAGVIGSSRLCYDLWGDSVNTAQRIEASGEPGAVCVSEPVYFKLRDRFSLEERELMDLKGKGLTKTYVLRDRRDNPRAVPSRDRSAPDILASL